MKRKLEQISNYLIAVFLCECVCGVKVVVGSSGLNDFLRLSLQQQQQLMSQMLFGARLAIGRLLFSLYL